MIRPKTLELAANQVTTFVALARDARLLEVEDAFFNTASAVFLPDVPGAPVLGGAIRKPFDNAEFLVGLAQSHPEFTTDLVVLPFEPDSPGGDAPPREPGLQVILAALRFLERNPSHALVLAGHTDRAGDDALNMRLSAARGRSVLAVLEGKRADFVAACSTFHAPEDDVIILRFAARTRGFQCEPADSKRASPEEIRVFQRSFNEAFGARIAVDGVVGNETRGAYFDLYEDELATEAGGADALRALRGQLRFVDPAHKVLALGERFPRENPQEDGLRSQLNRRVELLFFAPPRLPDVAAPDAGAQIFRRKLFAFDTLDRSSLAVSTVGAPLVTAPAGIRIVAASAPPAGVDGSEVVSTQMPDAGRANANNPWGFLIPFVTHHPDEGALPRRPNSPPSPPPTPPQPPPPEPGPVVV